MESNTLISIELIKDQQTPIRFSADLHIIFGLQGSSIAVVNQQQFDLKTGGLLAVNPFAHYSLTCESQSGVMVLHIPQEIMKINGLNRDSMRIICYIADDYSGVHSEYDQIRMYFARIFQEYFQNGMKIEPRIVTYTTQLLSVLLEQFSVQGSELNLQQSWKTTHDRYNQILQYIHEHWREPITLENIAKEEYLSVGYLARFFKKYIGTSFTEYLKELRLQNAAHDLIVNKESVTGIAYSNGFKSTNLFITYFRTRYGQTPKQYRSNEQSKRAEAWNMLPMKHGQDGVSALLQYTALDEQYKVTAPLPTEIHQAEVDVNAEVRQLNHTWRKLLNIGYARDGLLAEIQNRLRQAQQEIGFEYLRFHGILDEDMHVYHENEEHKAFLDFSHVDLLLDFILSIGLKPYIELSFMPELLAKQKLQIFDRVSYHSIYQDEQKWRFLICGFVQHCVERYGRTQVRKWRFTTIGCILTSIGRAVQLEEYLELYRVSFESVKAIDDLLLFGGPGGLASSIWDGGDIRAFLKFVKENQCVPDFICTQCYPYRSIEQDSDFLGFAKSQISAPTVLSGDEHFTRTMLRDYRQLLDEFGLAHLEFWIEEWNSTLWQRDLSSDTCYKAAWLVKNLTENYDDADAFGYWLLSDLMEEHASFKKIFHGGYGLFTYNGIPKSGWRAMQLLRKLGDTLLAAGEGWIITKSSAGIQIVFSHYCHYDNLYRFRYKALIDPQLAYGVFIEHGLLRYSIQLKGLRAGRYELQRYAITQSQGSAFDAWIKMGSPHYLRQNEADYLEKISQPSYHVEMVDLNDEFTVETLLEPHEMQMILLSSIDTPPLANC